MVPEARLQDGLAGVDGHQRDSEEAGARAGAQRLEAHVQVLCGVVAVQQRQRARVGRRVAEAAQRSLAATTAAFQSNESLPPLVQHLRNRKCSCEVWCVQGQIVSGPPQQHSGGRTQKVKAEAKVTCFN